MSEFVEIYLLSGADGPTALVPNIQKRLTNNLNWLDVMSNEESKFQNGFQGIVITGWSRYDHFAVLAELLPAAMPSLATNLISVSHGYFNASWQKGYSSAYVLHTVIHKMVHKK